MESIKESFRYVKPNNKQRKNNNQRIDKWFSSFEAAQSLNLVIDDLRSFIENENLNIHEDESIISKFFISTDKTYKRLDNQSFEEERKKRRKK